MTAADMADRGIPRLEGMAVREAEDGIEEEEEVI